MWNLLYEIFFELLNFYNKSLKSFNDLIIEKFITKMILINSFSMKSNNSLTLYYTISIFQASLFILSKEINLWITV